MVRYDSHPHRAYLALGFDVKAVWYTHVLEQDGTKCWLHADNHVGKKCGVGLVNLDIKRVHICHLFQQYRGTLSHTHTHTRAPQNVSCQAAQETEQHERST